MTVDLQTEICKLGKNGPLKLSPNLILQCMWLARFKVRFPEYWNQLHLLQVQEPALSIPMFWANRSLFEDIVAKHMEFKRPGSSAGYLLSPASLSAGSMSHLLSDSFLSCRSSGLANLSQSQEPCSLELVEPAGLLPFSMTAHLPSIADSVGSSNGPQDTCIELVV
jgi:hypothetical protein